jgi:hypothetical protein
MLTLENTAYLVADMAGDIRRLFHDLGLIAQGGLKLDGVRMKHSHRFMIQARQELDGCIEELNRIIENLGPAT